ncbi:MAG: glycosyl hydrolase family 8, partial [Chroococcales cyanobacterium]
PERDWMSLVESSYAVLEESSQLSRVGLPSDWVLLDTQTGDYYSVPATSDLETLYGFDAYRVWWRVALDAAWFDSPEASRFLEEHLFNLQQRWREEQYIPAQINLQGQPLVDYDSTSQYAMLYAALREVDPAMAQEIQEQKLLPTYSNGFWDNNSAYYVQNLAWFGLVSPTTINPNLLIADERL